MTHFMFNSYCPVGLWIIEDYNEDIEQDRIMLSALATASLH